ncbi:Zn(II)2Cys6 transcription factor [Aspergillus affinis]|uniref:Zn(II)2Cys6 transcription factor n=1 Tax=Aspergillus affinis TaxID=1070780 RepID=UPI0022FE9CCE|nr:uncharacterized protein KD926_006904 [Aspergillus affinis]KAI9041328.1 hypothetical protein KD926_006904 [Aspergillus affinis]
MADTSCHSCRRRRVKCDRTLPECRKCTLAGIECLGYGRLILWNKGIASRGKMMGKTFDMSLSPHSKTKPPSQFSSTSQFSICSSLVDPLLQDLGSRNARYIYHFDQIFCKEIVIYDTPNLNPVRQLLAYLSEYPMLREVFVATSACHLYYLSPAHARSETVYRDALVAKQKALHLLNQALSDLASADIDLIVAAILVLMYLEWIDSGTDVWRIHLEGAKRLINCLRRQTGSPAISSPARILRRWLVSELLVFDIIGSTISKSIPLTPSIYGIEDGFDLTAMLATAQTNNFCSCPAQLLQCILTLVQLSETSPLSDTQEATVAGVLDTVRSFNPFEWALSMQSLSPCADLHQRTWIASAYQAAIALYAPRLVISSPNRHRLQDDESSPDEQTEIQIQTQIQGYDEREREHLVNTIVTQLSQLDVDSGLFKSSIWPSFIAGAEATRPEHRSWALRHLATVSKALPYKTSTLAMDVLVLIWRGEDGATHSDGKDGLGKGSQGRGWIEMTRSLGADFFVA